jgi:hypothetical protein
MTFLTDIGLFTFPRWNLLEGIGKVDSEFCNTDGKKAY